MTAPPPTAGTRASDLPARSRAWTGLGGAAFVLLAVTLEVVGGSFANSPAPRWASALLPITWPMPLRVLWWLTVASASLWYRRSMAALGVPQRRLVTVFTVAPFVVFAGGVATGAEWATWH